MHPEIGPGNSPQLPPEILQSNRLRTVTNPRSGHDNAVNPSPKGPKPEPLLPDSRHRSGNLLRRQPHFHLTHKSVVPRWLPGEPDPKQLPHRTTRPITPHKKT